MIQFSGVTKCYGDQILFEEISFSLIPGERLGIVGRNGAGKSTIFNLILDVDQPDEGQIVKPRGYRIGHLAQHLKFTEESALKEACLGLPVDERDQEYRGEIILNGLGFSNDDVHKPPSDFSGGYQIRINLAKALLAEPNLLLLDEPTNYLDIVSARWLARFLAEWQNELIIITHDRTFMDSVCTHTMLIHRQTIRKIQGGTAKLYAQVAQDEEVYQNTRLNLEKKKKELEIFINRFRAQASKARLVQSKIKLLEKLEIGDELQNEAVLDFKFSQAQFLSKQMLEVKELSFSYPNLPLIKDLSFNVKPGDRIGIIGKNGKGKSTLLRLIANELKAESGSLALHQNCKLGYFGQTNIERLSPNLTVEQEIANVDRLLPYTRVRSVCGTMMFSGDSALKKISVLSGGERSRVTLGKIILEPSNILLLDEPTNHLDMESIQALVESLKNYSGAIIIVTHSEYILKELTNNLIVFQGEAPHLFLGGYEEFLEDEGWEDEEDLKPKKSKKNKQNNKDERVQRATERDQRNKMLEPLQKEIERLEQVIIDSETRLEQINKDLIKASEQKNGEKISILSQELVVVGKELDIRYEELDKAQTQFNNSQLNSK